MLTKQEENKLVRQFQKHKNYKILEKLAYEGLRLSFAIARKMSSPELYLIGFKGWRKALEAYDPNSTYRFSTYSTYWIKKAIKKSKNSI